VAAYDSYLGKQPGGARASDARSAKRALLSRIRKLEDQIDALNEDNPKNPVIATKRHGIDALNGW